MQSKLVIVALIGNILCAASCGSDSNGSSDANGPGSGGSGTGSNSGSGASNTGSGASNTGNGASNTGSGASNTGSGASNTGSGASNTGSGASSSGTGASSSGTGASNSGGGAANNGGTGNQGGTGTSTTGGSTSVTGGSTGMSLPPPTPSATADNSVTTALPPVPSMTNVVASQRNDSVGIEFDPIDGAKDYRVYPLPADGDIVKNADGSVTVKNAIYRCSGTRQTYPLNSKAKSYGAQAGPTTQVATFDTDPTKDSLGWVYLEAGTGRKPVYALGAIKDMALDDELGWKEARLKIYTADPAQRTTLLGQGWRDDGVVFYVPSAAATGTQTVYGSQKSETVAGQGWKRYHQYYYLAASKSSHGSDTVAPAAAFEVLTASAAGTTPLMSVFYSSGTHEHTELVAGGERFQRAAYQGNGPLWHLEWAGLTAKTTLVVEALDSPCPFQGLLSPQSMPKSTSPAHQALMTLDDLKAASPTGEVYVNGQGDTTTTPKALARSFVTVQPQPVAAGDWDWFKDFSASSTFGAVKSVAGCSDFNCGRWQSPDFDFSMYRVEQVGKNFLFTYGQFMGQFWVVYDDSAGDVTGKVRFTARQKANIDTDETKYLHVTLSVDIVATDRRYPQLIISDQDAPVQEGLAKSTNNTLLVQPIQGPPMRFELQAIHGLINGNPWDVNNQGREHRFIDTESSPNEPSEWPFEHAGMDRMTRFDVYVSSKRMYSFMDGKPAGCTLLPSGFALTGPVTVTFGDVLYHEGAADELVCSQSLPYGFMHKHQCSETKRHYDDFGFKSASDGPMWDETKFPCKAY